MLCTIILFSILINFIFIWLTKWKASVIVKKTIVAIACIFIIGRFVFYIIRQIYPGSNSKADSTVFEDVDALKKLTEPASLIGMPGGGNVAYFMDDRTIVNLDGLVNSPEYFRALKNGTANDFLNKLNLRYVYGKEYMIKSSDPYEAIFVNRLEEIKQIPGTGGFVLYRYLQKSK